MIRHRPATLEDLAVPPETWAGLNPESRRMIEVACLGKAAIPTQKEARSLAESLTARNRQTGEPRPCRAYRCPFTLGERHHFHVGRVPEMSTVEATARTIRDLHGDRPPTWVDGKNPKAVRSVA